MRNVAEDQAEGEVEVKEVGKVGMLEVAEWAGTLHRAEGLEGGDWKVGTWNGSRGWTGRRSLGADPEGLEGGRLNGQRG